MILGNCRVATKAVNVSGFYAIEADLPSTLEATKGDAFKVTLAADDSVLDHVHAVKVGETLKLSLDHGAY